MPPLRPPPSAPDPPAAQPLRGATRTLLGVAVALCLFPMVLSPAAAESGSVADWLPLEPGTEQRFRLTRQQRFGAEGGRIANSTRFGESWLRMTRPEAAKGSPESPAGVVAVHRVDVEREPRLLSDLPEKRESAVEHYRARADRVDFLLHRQDGATQRYDPPLPLLRAPLRPGERWRLGRLRNRELTLDLEAEVVGRGPLSAGGVDYADALALRYAGPVEGRLSLPESPMTISQGRYERELWLVSGVGIVKEVVALDLHLVDSDERRFELVDVQTRIRMPAGKQSAESEPAAP